MSGAASMGDGVEENVDQDSDQDDDFSQRRPTLSRSQKLKRDLDRKSKQEQQKKLELPNPEDLTDEQLARIDVLLLF